MHSAIMYRQTAFGKSRFHTEWTGQIAFTFTKNAHVYSFGGTIWGEALIRFTFSFDIGCLPAIIN